MIEELASRSAGALHTAVLFARQAAGRSALDTLQRASGALAAAATLCEVAQAVVAHGRAGLRADAAVLVMIDERGTQVTACDPEECPLDERRLVELAGRAGEGSRPHTERMPDGTGVVLVPLSIVGRTIGALVLLVPRGRVLADEEMSMLLTLGSRCAGALARATLYERDRDTALVLQRRLLPDLSAVPSWIDAAARYAPATGGQIGGDWFQLVDAGNGRLVVAVGDAVGHGMVSAAAMGQFASCDRHGGVHDPAIQQPRSRSSTASPVRALTRSLRLPSSR